MNIDGANEDIAKAILKLRTKEEVENFLDDILTPKESLNLATRLDIAYKLSQKKQYLDISRLTGASSATISKVNEKLNYGKGGLKLLVDRIRK